MENNRILNRGSTTQIARLFSGSSFATDPLNSFYDVQRIKEEIAQYVAFRVKEAKREGAHEVLSNLKSITLQEINDYIGLVTKIVDVVIKMIEDLKKKASGIDLNIVESRTNFDYIGKEVKVLFIIDADIDNEKEFSNLLDELKRVVFEKENYVTEILYINKRDVKLDEVSINNDFPSVRNKEKVK